ncbi:MAG: sugar kinase [Anaerolineaceae bacterium]|nr:sugar kinase [Anaerolineaceae bacterium]MCB9099770.1 sugar kinase [Anaerolineales bacterium]
MKKIVTFGEIMLRLGPPGFERFTQAHTFEVIYGGAEANVAISLAHFGESTDYVTRLPDNDLAEACLGSLRQHRVGTDHVLRGGDRLGIYFVEKGAAQRGSKVIYDRAGSSFAALEPGMIDWQAALAEAAWFHWSGITPALTPGAAAACREAITTARSLGLTISCDLNYRHALWKWGKSSAEVMPELVAMGEIVMGNPETVETMFGITAPDPAGDPVEQTRLVAEQLAARCPNLTTIAFTARESHSASHNTWSATLWQAGHFYSGPSYDLTPIIDRVGGGDAFTAGLIYGLRRKPDEPTYALRFATAAACLKHTIPGDSNLVTVAEVEHLMSGDGSGRISR